MMERILDAQKVLKDIIVKTPVIPADGLCDAEKVYLKAENLQKTGSFKLRGAFYRISHLTEEEKKRGVIACSAGNHAQGVALAAEREGIECVICMPEGAPISKVQKTEGYGAKVVLVPGVFDDAFAKAKELEKEKGYVFIHPFDDEDIIAGQGTIGVEINEQVPDADIVLVAVGGGGLISGVATAIKSLNPSCKVYGVEAANAASMTDSIHKNKIITLDSVDTVADGIAVKSPGPTTFGICQQAVDGFVTVTENQITLAMLRLLEEHKILVEGAGAASVAAAMFRKIDTKDKKVVCVVSGGNVDINVVERTIAKGLRQTGRVMNYTTCLADKPHELESLLKVFGDAGANILSIQHDRSDLTVDLKHCLVHVVFEARGPEHLKSIVDALTAKGYTMFSGS